MTLETFIVKGKEGGTEYVDGIPTASRPIGSAFMALFPGSLVVYQVTAGPTATEKDITPLDYDLARNNVHLTSISGYIE